MPLDGLREHPSVLPLAWSSDQPSAGRSCLLHRRADDQELVAVAGEGTLDEQEVALWDDVDDEQFLDGAGVDAHVARHALALEHASRRLALPDGSHVAVYLVRGRAVARGALHVVPLEHALEPEAARGAGDVDVLALLDERDRDLAADRVIGEELRVHAELLDGGMRLLVALLVFAQLGLGGVLDLLLGELAVRKLQRGVAVALLRPVPEDQVWLHLDDRDREGVAIVGEHRGHADLLADETLRHLTAPSRCPPRECATTARCLPAGGGPSGPKRLQAASHDAGPRLV